MDVKTFAGKDFNPKHWINKAWNSSGSHEKEVFVANTVARLQLYMKQLSNSLDETTTQIVSSVPRVLQDASTLQVEGTLLQQKLEALEQQVQGVQRETGQSIESLQRIDHLKSRLENAAAGLREADKWAALAAALEEALDGGLDRLPELARRAADMRASLEVLADAPDYELKRVQMETLFNRLEAAVSGPLVDALTQMDAERTAPYVSVLAAMGRGAWAARCWRRAAAARAAPAWRRRPAAAPPLPAAHHHQIEWLSNVLKAERPLAELIALYTELLRSLDPTPTKVVRAMFKLCADAEAGARLLRDVRAEIDGFVRGVRAALDAHASRETVPAGALRELGRAAYAPLRSLLPDYTELQTQLLLAPLQAPGLHQEGLLERSRAILEAAERCEAWLAAAADQAWAIAGHAGFAYYAPAAEALIAAVLSLVNEHARRVEAAFRASGGGGGGGGVLSEAFPAALALHAAAAALPAAPPAPAAGSKDAGEDADTPLHPFDDMASLLLEGERGAEGEARWAEAARRAAEQLRALARDILRAPPHAQLDKVPRLPAWTDNDALSTDLPDFALSPQEYITEIGQYLMTLPQHLEMYLPEKQAPWHFLSDVCTYTCEVYAERILTIRDMDALGARRCLTDIAYLASVVEDLGGTVPPALRRLERSLRAAPAH